jgi:hypothetical protein
MEAWPWRLQRMVTVLVCNIEYSVIRSINWHEGNKRRSLLICYFA